MWEVLVYYPVSHWVRCNTRGALAAAPLLLIWSCHLLSSRTRLCSAPHMLSNHCMTQFADVGWRLACIQRRKRFRRRCGAARHSRQLLPRGLQTLGPSPWSSKRSRIRRFSLQQHCHLYRRRQHTLGTCSPHATRVVPNCSQCIVPYTYCLCVTTAQHPFSLNLINLRAK